MDDTEKKEQEKQSQKHAFIILGVAAMIYLSIMFWYIALPVFAVAGYLFYRKFNSDKVFNQRVKDKVSGSWSKFKAFMKR